MMLAAAMEMVDVVRSQAGRPPRHSEKAAEGERDDPEQGQAPPRAAGPGRAQLGAAPEHPLVHGGAPAQGPPPREAKFGAQGGERARGGGRLRVGCGAPPHRASAPILSLLRTVFSGSWSPPCLAPQRIPNIAEANAAEGGLSGKAAPGNSKRGAGGCAQVPRAPGAPAVLPKSFGEERSRVGAGTG